MATNNLARPKTQGKPAGEREPALQAHDRLMYLASVIDTGEMLMDVVAAVESLCDEANAGARAVGLLDVDEDGNGGRLDVLEEHRNEALRALVILRDRSNEVRDALRGFAMNPLKRDEIAPLFMADARSEAAE